MNLEEFVNGLDFDNYDYFYHETGKGIGESVLEEGLLVDGTNILDVDNILFTTACPFTKDIVSSLSSFIDEEYSPTRGRDVSEIIILVAPKDLGGFIVDPLNDYIDGAFYEGIVPPTRVLGYIDMGSKEFVPNDIYLEIAEDKGLGRSV